MTLLSFSEPSGKMKDCDIWKCAKMKSTSLQAEHTQAQDESKVEEKSVELKGNEWPFLNYASLKLENELEPTQLSYSLPATQEEKDRSIFRTITADLLKPLMGFAISHLICGQCYQSLWKFNTPVHITEYISVKIANTLIALMRLERYGK